MGCRGPGSARAAFAALLVTVAPTVLAQAPNLPPRASRAAAGPAIVVPRASCGTYWTSWVKDPNADVNPCPKGCERGKRLQLDQHRNGKATEYQANYECYLPKLEVPQPALKARAAGTPPRRDCGTMWTGWQSDPKSAANPCPANCERGELRLVNRSLTDGKLVYDMNYRCYFKEADTAQASPPSPQNAPAAATPRIIESEPIRLTGTRVPPRFVKTRRIRLAGTRVQPKFVTTPQILLTGTRK